MKKLTTLLAIMLLFSCTKPEYRWAYSGKLTSIRVDDDGEYHFTTDNVTEHDVHRFSVTIQRSNVIEPELWVYQMKCPNGKFCNKGSNKWEDVYCTWLFVFPHNYKIETFND